MGAYARADAGVSMKSGLRDRNNVDDVVVELRDFPVVSMKSGLRDRNNRQAAAPQSEPVLPVSMKSGLGDRNNRGQYMTVRLPEDMSQ